MNNSAPTPSPAGADVHGRWTQLDSSRSTVLQRARQCAELTIPALMPPAGATQNTVLPTPFQSLGARGVNNLASKLLLALFPANTPFFRMHLDDEVAAALGGDKAKVEELMRLVENKILRKIEASSLRGMLFAALKHMIVTGNALLHMPKSGEVRMFRLNQYVVLRDASGALTELIIREEVAPETLPEDVRTACQVQTPPSPKDSKPCVVYTHAVRKGDTIEWRQYVNNIEVTGSFGRVPLDESPFIVLRWQAVENEDYGRGLVEEYLGDLISLEGLNKAILQFSAAAAKILFLLHPNSVTDEDELVEAESGQIITGKKDDIDVLQVEKFNDFQVAKATVDELTLRLSHAFLLQTGTVRNAERVTAEEIRAQAQELEDVLGGVYTVLGRELQHPLVVRFMAIMRENRELPPFPKVDGRSSITPMIVTGFDALGRGHELNRFRALYADLQGILGPEGAQAIFSRERVAQRLATQHNVDIDDLLLTDEEKQAAMAQQMGSQMLDKGLAPAINAMSKQEATGG